MTRISRREFLRGAAATLGIAALGKQAHSLSSLAQGQAGPAQPNIIIIVFDTLSAGHTSLYGYRRQTTASLERFAERATVFHRHYAGGNFTSPGTGTILTGTHAWTHRAFNHTGTLAESFHDRNLFSAFAGTPYQRIAYSHNLLADSLLYHCRSHIDLHLPPTSFCLSSGELGLQLLPNDADLAWRGFEDLILKRGHEPPSSLFLSFPDQVRVSLNKRIRTAPRLADYPRDVPELFKLTFTLEDVIAGIQDVLSRAPQPFLAYFHLLPPHEPYRPHRDFIGLFDDGWAPEEKAESVFSANVPQRELNQLHRQYDEFLAYADHHFGRLHDFLTSSGRMDDSIVVFTSDHGQLFERGIHGHVTPVMYEPLVKIPLMISLPGQQTRQDIHSLTGNVDLVPTLAHLAGLPSPDWPEGVILPPYAPETPGRTLVAMEAKRNYKAAPIENATIALWRENYKSLHYLGEHKRGDELELFDLQNDPEERVNIASSQKSVAGEFADELKTLLEEINRHDRSS